MSYAPMLRLNEVADEWGMTASDMRAMNAGLAAYDRSQRRRALRALWLKPVVDRVRHDGVTCYRDNRGDEWTFRRAIQATVGLMLDRRWSDSAESRWRTRRPKESRYIFGFDMAYWDAGPVYGGYTVEVMRLYPGCRVSLFNDGETNL